MGNTDSKNCRYCDDEETPPAHHDGVWTMGPVKKAFFLEIGILTGETVANKILEGEN